MTILDLVNAARAAHGVPPLRPNSRLDAAALEHAQDMAQHPYLTEGDSHVGSDGSTVWQRAQRAGYQGTAAREITGWGWGDWNEQQQMVYWQFSPPHAAILFDSSLNEVGAAYLPDAPGPLWTRYWVVEFGRSGATDEPTPPDKPFPYTTHVPIVVGGGGVGAPTAGEIDLLDYLRGDGRAYMVRHPDGNQEKFRTVRDGARFRQLKNSQWEEFWYTDDYIWRGVDTSPGDGQYYRQFEDGQGGARWCPRRMDVGQGWIAPVQHTVQTYRKSNCAPVDHHRNGRTTNRLQLVGQHMPMRFNEVTVEDVIKVVSSTGESMWFGRGYGLVAWESGWGSSAITHVLPAHEADNVPETGCFGE